MWNLIKNVFRSLSRNKISVIGLTFLIFLSVGIFTVLNSVSTNISNEYSDISTSGNLHDFTVAENYNNGNPKYDFDNNPEDSAYMGLSSDDQRVPWPVQTTSEGETFRTYQISLNVNDQKGTLLWDFYQKHNETTDPYYNTLLHPLIQIENDAYPSLSYLNSTPDHISTKTKSQIDEELGDSGDLRLLLLQENQLEIDLINVVTQTDTPMQTYLNSPEMTDKVSWRNFKSLDINNSPDGKLYKIVQSNPEDKIDKVVLFGDKQQNNFSITNFNPMQGSGIDLKTLFPDTDDPIGICLSYNNELPNAFEEFKADLKAQAFFALLSRGDDVSQLQGTDLILYNDIKNLSNPNLWNNSDYINYLNNYKTKFFLQNKGYRYSINWNTITPQSWVLQDWTAHYAVVSPEYLQHNNISPFQITNRDQFINDLNAGYANNLTQNYTQTQFANFIKDHAKNVILNSTDSANLPIVVIGSGITADFIYPIFDIQHATPNPNKECIIFGNTNVYKRIFDSYRGNQTENYLVGVFNGNVDRTATLDSMNATAKELMSWPQGIQACYFVNDTNDVLNASAFRVAFIPLLVNKIQIINNSLIFFVVILSLLICAIVVQRYISNSRTQIGVMQANGINKRRIAVSLIPFALLPAIVGGIGGYLIGFFLQNPAINLFSNYWMLPTPIASFNVWVLLISVLLPFLVFISVSIITTFVVLREKTVDLMKNGSEFRGSFVARHIKAPFRSFGIMTKFRITVAFNSIWKLIILSVMVSLSISALVFGINTYGKFSDAEQKTFASRNYSYAIDLYSPTDQGGQYIPVNADISGETGFVQSNDNTSWIPSIYFDSHSQTAGDLSYKNVFGEASPETKNDEFFGIPKVYYNETYDIYDAATLSTGKIEESFVSEDGKTTHASILYPMMSDAIGETNDLMYLKNHSMFKTGLDFTVGAFGMTSNPWSIAVSLMPENSKNMADARTVQMIQALGEATSWEDKTNPNNPDPNNLYGKYYELFHNQKQWNKYFVQLETTDPNQRIDPNCPYNYSLNKDNCIPKIFDISIGNLEPDFMSFLNYVYTNNNFEIINQKYDTASDNDYQIIYNKVSLKQPSSDEKGDETYTYLSTNKVGSNDTTKIIGLKSNSQYVNLTSSDNNKRINDLINDENTIKGIKAGYFPIIINAYAQHKYHLNVNDTIQFKVNNKANRFTNEINGMNEDLTVPFKIVGVNTTYQGEEYFTNQELANYILGLRSRLTEQIPELPKTCNLHNYYINNEKQDSILELLNLEHWYQVPFNIAQVDSTQRDGTQKANDLMDLSQFTTVNDPHDTWINPSWNYVNNNEPYGNIIPYGFNGVFTQKTNGSSLLNGGNSLYSPSGIYPGNDSLNSDVVKNILKQSANLEFANIITGYWQTEAGKAVTNQYLTWQEAVSVGANQEATYNAFISDDNVNAFTNWLTQMYGNTSVTLLVQWANDKSSTHLIFNNLSNTISQIENVILIIVSLMVMIIVMLITVMLIGDSKKLAAILKSLGYYDKENAASFLSIYVPVILLGLLLSIPLSFALIYAFQAIIFTGGGILLLANVKWWSFLVGMGGILLIFLISGLWGYSFLKRDRLIDMIKE